MSSGGFMNLSKKVVSVAAAAALVVGAGAITAAPASAKVKRTISGSTIVNVPFALIAQAGEAGVDIAPIKPARAEVTTDVVAVDLPVTWPKTDGVLPHKGGLSFASSVTGVTLTFSNPVIEYATGGGPVDTAVIAGTIGGIPEGNPLAGLNGKSVQLLDVKNFKLKWNVSKPKKVGKKYQKTITQTMSGDVFVSSNGDIIGGVNTLMGTPLLTAGMPFGDLKTKWSVNVTCDTLKECK
jgi:hypothetical protein